MNKQEDYTELKTQLRYIQRENQSLKEENENKRRRIERVLSQNNKLLKLNYKIYNNKYNVTHYREKSVKECPKRNGFQTASKTATTKIKQSLEKDMYNRIPVIFSFHLMVLEDYFMKIIIMMTMKA